MCGLDFDLDQGDDSSPPAPTMPYEPVGEWRGDAEWGGGFVEEPSVGEVAERWFVGDRRYRLRSFEAKPMCAIGSPL